MEDIQIEDWKFNQDTAKKFAEHARKHIPGYDRVIDKSVKFIEYYIKKTEPIIDVGCATGETLKRLNQLGFTNLHGVDNSIDMLNEIPKNIATLTCSDSFPLDKKYKAITMNWTLHFIKNKLEYIKNISNGLEQDGFLILTDKTQNDGKFLDLYHNFKKQQGLTDLEIETKAKQLRNIMYIDSQEWYLSQLKSFNFSDVIIIDADWCFTTFIAKKNNQI
jgi:tRNA (cmo5U34)-methyltransferase